METTIRDRLQHAWNSFMNRDPIDEYRHIEPGISYGNRPDRVRLTFGNERSIIASVYNRLAIDVAAIAIQHARLDKDNRFLETEDSPLNYCLTVEANIDQTGRALMQDAVMTVLTVAAPLLIVALVVGVVVSIIQATTQINEQTLVFIPKIVGMLLTLVLLGDWMLTRLNDYTVNLFEQINSIVK